MKSTQCKNNIYEMKRIFLVIFLFVTVITLSSCSANREEIIDTSLTQADAYIYYINKNETKIIGQGYEAKGITKEELVEEYLDALGTQPEDITLKQSKPDGIIIDKYAFNGAGLSLYFSSDYNNLTGITEVLCRASIVKTLCQIEEVDYVEFYVGGQPLMGVNEKPIVMGADDFIDDSSMENVFVTIYYSNEAGNKLVTSDLKITYEGNISIERLIMDRIIEGPKEENMIKAVPEGTKLIKATTKDGICYVDVNDKFLDKIQGINAEIVIYSIVNSLVELSTINKVQFTINGTAKKTYLEEIPFDSFFERNLDLVEGSK